LNEPSYTDQQFAEAVHSAKHSASYAYWERHPVALRPDQLLKVAEALNVSVEDLVGTNGKKKRGAGPTGRMRQLFEAASRLPRSQQQKIGAVVEAFVAQHANADRQ
jgi:hypothetical protein